ncbi:hypothetical protein [Myxosarcina sp. GI1(2024)]
MSYAEPLGDRFVQPIVNKTIVDYHDRVRWGPIFAGIVVSIATQLLLSALAVPIGFSAGALDADAEVLVSGISIWSIVSLLIALFLGSWITASTCGPMNKKTALLHGLILWATTLAISAWLLASGLSGTFGVVAANMGEILNQVERPGGINVPKQVPNISAAEAQNLAEYSVKTAWTFIFGSLLGLVAALIGAAIGARKPKVRIVNSR